MGYPIEAMSERESIGSRARRVTLAHDSGVRGRNRFHYCVTVQKGDRLISQTPHNAGGTVGLWAGPRRYLPAVKTVRSLELLFFPFFYVLSLIVFSAQYRRSCDHNHHPLGQSHT